MPATLTPPAPRLEAVVRLVEAEFREMPGMHLTADQVRRLWNLSEEECADLLEHLCAAGRLVRDNAGRYCRRGSGC